MDKRNRDNLTRVNLKLKTVSDYIDRSPIE